MAVPPRVPLGADQLARDWYADVNIGSLGTPNWIPINGWQDLKPTFNPTTQDTSDYDSGGYKDSAVTAIEWGLTGKLGRKSLAVDNLNYDQGQEVLRLASQQMGAGNRVHIRFYENGIGGPRVEAYDGFANCQWEPDGGGMEAVNLVSVTLGGKGKRNSITHPDTGLPPAPVITSVTPSTGIPAAGGALLIATGSNLASVTAVTINAVALNVADWEYAGGVIALKASAQTAGVKNLTMTNPGGTSANFSLTYV